jgi:hypothetical protein
MATRVQGTAIDFGIGSQQHKKVLDGGASAEREPIDGISQRKDHDTRLGHRQARSFW